MEKFILAVDPGTKEGFIIVDAASGTFTNHPASDPRDWDYSTLMPKKRILMIDDERCFADNREAVIARTSEDGIEHLQNGRWDEVWLDFVLVGDDTLTVAKWVRELHADGGNVDVGTFIVHSSAIGAHQLLEMILSPLGYTVIPEFNTHGLFTLKGDK